MKSVFELYGLNDILWNLYYSSMNCMTKKAVFQLYELCDIYTNCIWTKWTVTCYEISISTVLTKWYAIKSVFELCGLNGALWNLYLNYMDWISSYEIHIWSVWIEWHIKSVFDLYRLNDILWNPYLNYMD